jgi:uncharacterized protein (DUF736 family)
MDTKYDNSGSLFRNEKKASEKHPDYSGSITIGGIDYWLSGWVKESKAGKKFFSLSVKPKEQQATSAPKVEATLEAPVFPDSPTDDLPF